MQNSKQFLKEQNIRPTISFKQQAKHVVTLMKDKTKIISTPQGDKSGVEYLVKENGEEKTFFTGSVGLIQKLAELNEGDTVEIEMQQRPGSQGGVISVYEVKPVQANATQPSPEQIPVVQEGQPTPQTPQADNMSQNPENEPAPAQMGQEPIQKSSEGDEIQVKDIPF